jgi:hypothetical protein
MKRKQEWQQEIPGAAEKPEPQFDDRRGARYDMDALPGEVIPQRHKHDGATVFPFETECEKAYWQGSGHNLGHELMHREHLGRHRKPKRVFTQGRKFGSRAAPPVYTKILAAMATPAGTVDELVTGATARGKPTVRGQRCKEMLALFVQMMREVGYSPAAIQGLTGLSPSQVTRLSANELRGLRSVADRVDWSMPSTRRIDRDSYTAPSRTEHPAHRTGFGANQTEDAAHRARREKTEDAVNQAEMEAVVIELQQTVAVLATNQVVQADRLDLLEGLERPKAPRDTSAMFERLAP